MKKFSLSLICIVSLISVQAKETKKIPAKSSFANFRLTTSCYSSFNYQGHTIELFVVYEGDRCNTSSQAGAMYIDGVLAGDGDVTNFALDITCGAVNCI